MLIQYLK